MRTCADQHLARFEGEQALRAYEDALVVDSRDGSAAAGCLRALLLLGRHRWARHGLSPLLVEFPRWPHVHVVRGEIALGRRDDPVFAGTLDGSSHCNVDAAREAFGEALRLDPECAQAWRGLAAAFRVSGQSDEAIAILAKAESEIGWRSGLVLERAICARDDGRLSDALAYVQEALASMPGHPEARIIHARLLVQLGRPEDAMTSVYALARARIDSAPVHMAAARIFDMLIDRSADAHWRSHHRAARDTLIAAAFRDPGCSASVFSFTVHTVLDDDSRRKEFRRALEGAPESPALLVGLAGQLDYDGDANGALDCTQRALEAHPAYLPASTNRVLALMTAGRLADADKLATQLVQRHPRIAVARRAAAAVSYNLDRFEVALEHEVAIRESIPNSPFVLGAISQNYRRLGNIPAAEKQLRLAIEQWPGIPKLLQQQARCAAAEDRKREARTLRRKAIAIELGDRRMSREPGAGRKLMRHTLVSWLLGRLPDWEVNDAALKELESDAKDYRGRDRVPADGRDRITGMLRELDWDAARSFALAARVAGWVLLLVGLAILFAEFTAPFWGSQMAGLTEPSLGLFVGLFVLSQVTFVSAVRLATLTRPRVNIAIAGILAGLILAYFATVHDELPSRIAFAAVIAVMLPAFFAEVFVILAGALGWGAGAWEGRASTRHPVAAMISGLLELSSLLDDKNVIDVWQRTSCLEIVEELAQAQKIALLMPLGHVPRREDAARAERAERWVAGTVEATRRLKELLLASNAASVSFLRNRVAEMLSIVCSERWKDLAEELPPSGGKRARAWLSITARTLIVAVVPAAVLLLYQLVIVRFTHDLPRVPTWLVAVAYGIWPVVTVLWRLDPDFAAKAGLLGHLGGTPGAGTSGDSRQSGPRA